MLLYSLLFNSYEKIKWILKFRQLDSICAGHPEYYNSGIETTTGPLIG